MSSAESDPDHDEARAHGGGLDPARLLNAAAEEIAAEARRHPLRTLGIAFAAGYVLGGGVPQFAVRMATTAALRSLGRAAITSGLALDLARGAFAGARRQRPATCVKNGKARTKPKASRGKAGGNLPS